MIEFCTAAESMTGKVGKDLGVHLIPCSENHLRIGDKETMKVLHNIVGTKSGADLLGFLAM